MASNNGGVPPGFRFHPTDEELLHYYLKKKVSFEKFDLEVIREVDLNKMEPWDLQERCKIGSTPQNEWYFFSHKDRKYPTGSRTNRATNAGFWKATGRDKCIRNTFKKIGMRKTLVFYRGRAPHGQKTDWIMHEYRLEDNDTNTDAQSLNNNGSEDGWVVCRVFKKKNLFKVGGNHEGGGGGHGGGSNNNMSSATAAEHHQAALLMMNNHQQPRTLTLRDDTSTHHQYLHGRQQQQQQQQHQHHMTTFDLYNNNISSSAADHHYSSIMQPQTSFLHNTHKPIGGGTADVGYADYSSSNPAMLKQLLSSNNQRADHCESGSTDDHSLCLAGGGLQQYHHQTPGTALDHHQVGNCEAPNDWAMLDRLVMTTTATAAQHLGGSGGGGGQEVEVEVEEEESSKGAGVVRLFGDDDQQHHQQQHPNIINTPSSSSLHQINPHEQQLSLRGEMMDFWGYGK